MKTPYLNSTYKWSFALCAVLVFSITGYAGMEKNPIVENLQRPFDWTGFYIGGNIGGVLSEYEFTGSGGDTEGRLFSDVDIGEQFFVPLPGVDVVRFVDRIDALHHPNREDFISA